VTVLGTGADTNVRLTMAPRKAGPNMMGGQ